MNKIQEKCFNILLEIDRVCKLAHLQYYIYAGTLLGAVRHGGFIPWDDDIDIVMLREDYDKFPTACELYLEHSQFELQTTNTDPMASNPWMKLHDKNTAFISGLRRDGAMEGLNIDIFPVDNAPDDVKILNRRARYFDFMNIVYEFRYSYHNPNSSLKMKLFQRFVSLIPPLSEKKFKKKYDEKIREYNGQKTRSVVYFSNRKYLKKVIDRSAFDETVMLSFEGICFPAPREWKVVLEGLYGKNYMQLPPKEQQVTVHGTAVIDLEHSWTEYKRGENGYEKV